ncbi:MAG: ribonuclease Z [archaeon]|nr:ribonuclease Z [Candidatus Micrarchaeota archaeon]
MKITLLGTSSSTPTKDRNFSSVNINFHGLNYLFDCPEGTQRQMMKGKVSYMKIAAIFISHFHGDHLLGLPGLLATMTLHQREVPLKIFGPKGVKAIVRKAVELSFLRVGFALDAMEVKQGKIWDEEEFTVHAFKLNHEVPCFGYVFREKDSSGRFLKEKAKALGIPEGPLWGQLQKGKAVNFKGKKVKPEEVLDEKSKRKGRKISIIFDTSPTNNAIKFIEESDVLFHEASFLDSMKSRAKETFHSTAMDAARIAEKGRVKKLILFHLSPRHKEKDKFGIEAGQVFPESIVGEDLMEIEL